MNRLSRLKTLFKAVPAIPMLVAGLLANPAAAQELLISGVIDGPLTGGIPKAVEVYVVSDIPDLSIYGLGAANNGGGTDGEEFTFPAVAASAGDFIYVASEASGFTSFFGFAPSYTGSAASINGDDAVELFKDDIVVDVFGDINVDGSGEPWEYLDGWAYRSDNTGPDGSTFTLGNWAFSGPNALDGEETNAAAAVPFPLGTFTLPGGDVPPTVRSTSPADGADDVAVDADVDIMFSEAVIVAGSWFDIFCGISGAHIGTVSSGDSTNYRIDPDADFVAGDNCTVTVFATQVEDQDGTPDNMVADFNFSFEVPAPPELVKIHEVQGSGDSSPLAGQTVIIQGVVIGDYQANDQLRGFFVEEEDADHDADPATSEGIFVFAPNATDVAEGDEVTVTGVAGEFFGLTQVSASTVAIETSGNSLPTAASIDLPVPSADIYESFEGMRVLFNDPLYVSEYFELARYGQIVLTQGGRVSQFTSTNSPDVAGYEAYQEELARRRVIVDDDNSRQNAALPDGVLFHPQPNGFGVGLQGNNYFRGGDVVDSLIGVLDYSFGSWVVRPTDTNPVTFAVTNMRPDEPDPVGGGIQVASMNVLNYFTTIDEGGNRCGPNLIGCRGADSAAELTRQRDKIVSALSAIDAEVVGLIEIENNASASLTDLVAGLNAVTVAGTYSYIDTGTIGTDAIKVGLIYKPAMMTPAGSTAVLDSDAFVDPNNTGSPKNRPALAQTFTENSSGANLTVVVNHLKSKGSSCGPGDDSQEDGQANCNGTRQAAAAALMDWLATDPTGSGDPDVLVIGDLNAYAKEDPISTIIAAGYTNLIDQFIGEQAYTFVFDGQLGYLDHALANDSLTQQVTGTAVWHINADEVNVFDYNDDVLDSSERSFEEEPDGNVLYEPNAFRSSDHDPIVVGLDLIGDLDGDGVLNDDDACPMTPPGESVDSNGCSLAQLVPCEGPFGSTEGWKNHGQYVSAVAAAVNDFVDLGLIAKNEKGKTISAAARSSCGK